MDGQQGSYYYPASNPSGYQTTSGTVAQSNYVSGSAFATTGSPSNVLEYQQASGQTDTRLSPSGDWYNSIRMGHGNPYNYYSNTIAMRMTGGGSGTMFTQYIGNNNPQGWRTQWDSGNDGSGSGLDADLLDGIQAASLLRSDADDTFTGNLTTGANNHITFGPNSTWGSSLRVCGNGRTATGTEMASIVTTDCNIHLDAAALDNGIYLNFYAGTNGTHFGNGAGAVVAKMDSAGQLYKSSTTANPYWNSANDGSGSGLDADLLDGIQADSFLRSDAADTFTGTLTMGTQQALVANNYGRGVFGLYSATRYQHVWSMGTAYKTSDDGTSYGNMYGLTWTHPNIGTGANQSIAGLSHQLQLRENGVLKCAFGTGIWTAHNITSGGQGTLWGSSNDGSGSGLDADLLDGIDSASFARRDAGNTFGSNQVNYFSVDRGGYCGSLTTGNLQAHASSNNSAFMSFHKGGNYAVNMGLDADNVLRIGGWSAAANRWVLDMSGNMTAAGNVTAYSDIRLKENIEVIPNALEKVQKIRGVTFTRNDQEDKEKLHIGVIAQEVEAVLPEVISEDNLGIKNVAYGNMVGLLIEAIKELKAEVDDLKSQLKEK